MSDAPDDRGGDTSSATGPVGAPPEATASLPQRNQATLPGGTPSPPAGCPRSGPASDSQVAPRPVLGTRLGKYVLSEPLGRGAMGVVYKATHEELGKVVALKVMSRPDLEGSISAFERFQLEARAAARLSHPNIVSVLDAGFADGYHYFTMEYVEGETLQHRLDRGCLDPMEAARIGEQIALALAHAHVNGVVHRDVKPQNILLAPDGQAKLADFGLAKDVYAGHGPTLTGQVLGTPNYMSPEQACGLVSEIDGRSDLFSLGAVLYECVTGHVPFNGSNVAEIIDQIRAREPRPMRFHSAVLSPEFEAIVFQAMEKDKRRRYQRAEDLVEDLARFRRGEMVLARRQTLFYRMRRRARKNWRIATFVAFVLAASAALVAVVQRSASIQAAAGHVEKEIADLVNKADNATRKRDAAAVQEVIDACDRAIALAPVQDARKATDPAAARAPISETGRAIALAHRLRGIALRRLLRVAEAREEFAKAFGLDPDRDDARYEAAVLDIDVGDTRSAEELLDTLAKRTQKGTVLHLMARARLAQIRSRKRETSPQEAADCHAEIDHDLDDVQKKDPLFADQYFFHASLVGWWAGYGGGLPKPPPRRPDLVLAAECLAEGLKVEPISLPAHLSRGENLRRLDRNQDAMRDLEAARALAPNDPRVHALHARAAAALRLYDFALSDLQQAIRLGKSDELLVYRGLVQICLGNNKAALEDAREAFALNSSKPENVFFLAVCLSLAGRERESADLARRWREANSPFFRQVARVDGEMLANPGVAAVFTKVLKSVERGVDDYFGVDPAVKKTTYTFMREIVARHAPAGRTTYGLKEAMEQIGTPNDLMPPEIEDMLLRADESDARQQEMLRATNLVLEAVAIRTPLEMLLSITRFTMKFHGLRGLAERTTVTDPTELYRRGCFLYYKGDRDSLLAARGDFRKCLERQPTHPRALYGLAVTSGRLQFVDEAIGALRRLKQTGHAGWVWVKDDTDFASINDTPEFRELMGD